MAGKLEGRRVLITGVSRGVGLETAKKFLSEGAGLIGVARDPDRLGKAAALLSALGDFQALRADLEKEGSEEALVRAVEERWGALDLLVNNAAVMVFPGHLKNGDGGNLRLHLESNVLAPHRLIRALLPLLEKGREPRVLNVSSGAGCLDAMRAGDDIAAYRLSKWSLNGLTLLWSDTLKGRVAVNSFDPGWVKTDMGGPQAPGEPAQSAEGALALAVAPFGQTGKFWKDGLEIPF